MQHLAYEFWVVLLAQKQSEYRLKQFYIYEDLLSMREQHSAYWHTLETKAKIYISMSSQVTPLIILFYRQSMNFSLLRSISVHSLPSLEALIVPSISKHISVFFAFVITIFISFYLIAAFIKLCISQFLDDLSTFLQNLRIVGSSLFIALSKILLKSQTDKCSTFLQLAAKLIAKASSSIAPMLGCGKRINFTTQSMQLVQARVYLMPASVDNRQRMLSAVILLGESCARRCTNLGISEAFSTASLACLSKTRLQQSVSAKFKRISF